MQKVDWKELIDSRIDSIPSLNSSIADFMSFSGAFRYKVLRDAPVPSEIFNVSESIEKSFGFYDSAQIVGVESPMTEAPKDAGDAKYLGCISASREGRTLSRLNILGMVPMASHSTFIYFNGDMSLEDKDRDVSLKIFKEMYSHFAEGLVHMMNPDVDNPYTVSASRRGSHYFLRYQNHQPVSTGSLALDELGLRGLDLSRTVYPRNGVLF